MRWFWIDRFVEFQRGRQAVAIKNFSLAEDYLTDYLPGYPIFPNSLVVEGIAQTGGLLAGEMGGFRERVVLAKLSKAVFHEIARPGQTLTYSAMLLDVKSDGAICQGTSRIGDKLQAEVEIFFAYLDDRFRGVDLFEPASFLAMLRLLGLYDVGKKEDGTPLDVPAHLLAAERAGGAEADLAKG